MKKSGILLAFLIAVSSGIVLQAAPVSSNGSTQVLSASSGSRKLTRKDELASSEAKKPTKPPIDRQEPVADTGSKPADTAAETKPAAKKTNEKNFLTRTETQILDKLNKERVRLGLEKLALNEDLQAAARLRSKELCQADKFWHKRPNGDEWDTVIKKDVPIKYLTAGENLSMTEYNDPNCKNASSASFWVNEWFNSPAHYENVVRSEFTHVGVGVYSIKKNGMTYAYATTIFAKLPPTA